MQEKANEKNILFLIRGAILATITVLLFYPRFGGELMVLNGTFIYFSYFLVAVLLILYAMIHVSVIIMHENKVTEEENQNHQKEEFVLFSYLAIMVMVGLLQGRYIMSPILGITFILLEFIPLYEIILMPEKGRKYFKRNMLSIFKEIIFFIVAILLVVGNQPFEQWNIPVADSLLLLLVLLNVFNMWVGIKKDETKSSIEREK